MARLSTDRSRHLLFITIIGVVFAGFAAADRFLFHIINWHTYHPFTRPDVYLSSAMLGGFAIYLVHGPSRRRLAAVVGAGLAVEVVSWISRGGAAQHLFAVGYGLFYAAVADLLIHRLRPGVAPRADAPLSTVLLLPGYVIMSFPALVLTVLLHPETYDPVFYSTDLTFGAPVQLAVQRLFETVPGLATLSMVAYAQLPLLYALLYCYRKRRALAGGDPLSGFVLMGAAGYIVYHTVPVVGPRYYAPFLAGLAHAGVLPDVAVGALPFPGNQPRNCVPSLHTVWALLLFMYTAGCRAWVRILAGAAALLILLATLGFGWHYLVDLVIAVPFLTMGRALLPRPGGRRRLSWVVFGTSGLLFFGWTAMVVLTPGVFGQATEMLWMLAVLGSVGCLYLDRRVHLEPVTHRR